MLRKLKSRVSYANVMSSIAVFAVLAGGTAYAAGGTIHSSDIVDGEVKSVDVGDGEVKSADVKDESLTTFDISTMLGADVVDGSLTGADIQDGSLNSADLANNSVSGSKVSDNSLTGADIDESTLNLAPVSTTTFANFQGPKAVSTLVPIMDKTVPAGSWAVTATVNSSVGTESHSGDVTRDVVCSLRDGGLHFLGGATDRRTAPAGQAAKRTLTMTGGFQSQASSNTVSVWCGAQGTEIIDYASMMLIRVGGFS